MSEKSRFRGPFEKQHGKRSQSLLKSASQHLYHLHRLLPSQLTWKKSLLLTCKILGPLVKTFAGDGKYPVVNRDSLMISIQMKLFKKQNPFSILGSIFEN